MIDVPNENLQVRCYIGAPQTGRTEALVQEAARLASNGASVLFVCARKRDARFVRQRIVDAILALRAQEGIDAEGPAPRSLADKIAVEGVAGCIEEIAVGDPTFGKASAAGEGNRKASGQVVALDNVETIANAASRSFADDLAAGKGLSRIRIATCIEVAQDVLGAPESQSMFGRGPRVLEPYEEAVLLEDLKVSQMKNRRLRQVLTYLRAGWSNLSDDTWERTAEEDLVIDRMRENLRFTGGVLACEASNLALHALRECDQLRQRASFDYVLVDDHELLSRASQHMIRLLAGRGLTAACAERPGLPADEEYPCFEGAAELLEAFPDAYVEHLNESGQSFEVQRIMNSMLADQALSSLIERDAVGDALTGGDGPAGNSESLCSGVGVHGGQIGSAGGSSPSVFGTSDGQAKPALRMLPSLEAELQTLAIESNAALERGESVLIVGANRLWRRNVAANLQRVGIPVRQLRAEGLHVKDFRDERQCGKVQADAACRLQTDPNDDVAWRTMLALGDAVARSAAVDYLRRAVEGPTGAAPVRLHEALELLEAGKVPVDELTLPLFDDLLAAYRKVKSECGLRDALSCVDDASPSVSGACGLLARSRGDRSGDAVRRDSGTRQVVSLLDDYVEDNARRGSDVELEAACSSQLAGRIRERNDQDGEMQVAGVRAWPEAAADPVIAVVSPEQAAGLRFDVVIFGGFVNGLIPCRAYCDPLGMAAQSRRREREKDVRTVYGVASCARKQLLFTGFATCGLQAAETMDAHIQSIKLRRGMRIVNTQPSDLAGLLP